MEKSFNPKDYPVQSKLPAEDRIAIAKGTIAQYSAFFGTIVFGYPFVESTEISTMATDGARILYNPDYISRLLTEEVPFEVLHETMHIVLGHIWRGKGFVHDVANRAMDIVLDIILVDSLNGAKFKLPRWCKLYRDLDTKGGSTFEGVYEILMQESAGGAGGAGVCGRGEGDIQFQDSKVDSSGSSNSEQNRAKMVLAQAVQAQEHSGCGSILTNLMALVRDILHPRLPWNLLLRDWFSEKTMELGDRTWARPSRRSYYLGYMLPGRIPNPGLGKVVIAGDWSGSMSEDQKNKIQAECNGIFEDCAPSSVEVLYFTSQIDRHDSFERGEPIKLGPAPTGGTAFSPIFRKVEELDEDPEVVIVFTDMECNDFGPPPPYPVLWVVIGPKYREYRPPFGVVIYGEGL